MARATSIMQLFAALQQDRFVGDFLRKSVLEDILDIRD
jgi:hypothetical protein